MPSVAHKPIENADKKEFFSLDEFLRMDFEEKTELVEGKIIQMGWANFTHASLVVWLGRKLGIGLTKMDGAG